MFFRDQPSYQRFLHIRPGEVWATKLLEEPERSYHPELGYTPDSMEVSLAGTTESGSGHVRIKMHNTGEALRTDIGLFTTTNHNLARLQSGIQEQYHFEIKQGEAITNLLPPPTPSGLLARAQMLNHGSPHTQALSQAEINPWSKRGLFSQLHKHMLPATSELHTNPEFATAYNYFDGVITDTAYKCEDLFLEKWQQEGRDLDWTRMPRKHLDTLVLASIGPYLTHAMQETIYGTPNELMNSKLIHSQFIGSAGADELTTVFERISHDYIQNLAELATNSYKYFAYVRSLLSHAGLSRSLGLKELEYLRRTGRLGMDFDPDELGADDSSQFNMIQAYAIPHNFDPAVLLAISDRLLLHEFQHSDHNMNSTELISGVVDKTLGMMSFVGDIQNSLLSGHGASRVAFPTHILEREYREDLIEYLLALRGS